MSEAILEVIETTDKKRPILQSWSMGDRNGGTRFAGVKFGITQTYPHVHIKRELSKGELKDLIKASKIELNKIGGELDCEECDMLFMALRMACDEIHKQEIELSGGVVTKMTYPSSVNFVQEYIVKAKKEIQNGKRKSN